MRWNPKESGCGEHTNLRANLWSNRQKPYKRLCVRVRLRFKSKPNNYMESCMINLADEWRKGNMWYLGRSVQHALKRGTYFRPLHACKARRRHRCAVALQTHRWRKYQALDSPLFSQCSTRGSAGTVRVSGLYQMPPAVFFCVWKKLLNKMLFCMEIWKKSRYNIDIKGVWQIDIYWDNKIIG